MMSEFGLDGLLAEAIAHRHESFAERPATPVGPLRRLLPTQPESALDIARLGELGRFSTINTRRPASAGRIASFNASGAALPSEQFPR